MQGLCFKDWRYRGMNVDIEQIRALAEILSAHGLTSLEVAEGETKVRLAKDADMTQTAQQVAPQPVPAEALVPEPESQPVNFNRLTEVKSPMVGVFYAAPSPDSEAYVSIGSAVKKGDVLCLIEAMKLMNEITAEEDGEIVDICVKNGDITEFGQVLFKMY
jgi:acetyl-CoA carboxylase biotin carboxyl carrier protein